MEMKCVDFFNRWSSGTGSDTIIMEDENGQRWADYGSMYMVKWPLPDDFEKIWPEDEISRKLAHKED
jgi:hypothetical protein